MLGVKVAQNKRKALRSPQNGGLRAESVTWNVACFMFSTLLALTTY